MLVEVHVSNIAASLTPYNSRYPSGGVVSTCLFRVKHANHKQSNAAWFGTPHNTVSNHIQRLLACMTE